MAYNVWMRLHLLPFGAPAWERRKTIFKDIIAARPGPPYDLRGVVYLAPNERTVRMMKVLFLDAIHEATGSKGCIPSAFHALNRFISGRVRQSSKARVVEGLERELVIEELCRKVARRTPELGLHTEVGLSLAPLVCAALDKIYTFGADERRMREFARDSLPLGFLMEVKGAYETWLERNGFADISALRAVYRPGPDEFGFGAVILDGLYDADPAEMRVLKALAMTPESHLIIQAPGIRLDGTATEGSPYFGTEGIIRELCGDITTEEAFGQHNMEAAILAGALFEGAPVRKSYEAIKALGEKRREITVAGALNPAEEVYFIARDIKESCLDGNGPSLDRILVYPASAAYLPIIREAFTDYGIPHHISQGTPLTQSPVVASFLDLLSLPAERFSFSAMRRVFASPFIRLWPDGNRLEAFDVFARKGGITGGRQRWVKAADGTAGNNGDLSFIPPLRQLLSLAGRVNGTKSLVAWADDCLHVLNDAGFPGAVEQYSDDRPEIAAAFEALLKELQRIKEYQAAMPGGMEAGRFVRVLKKLLSEKSFSANSGTVSGVRILGRQEVFSEPFDAVYACGLSDGTLPAPVRRDIFLPDGLAKALGLPASRESLTRDARLFLALLLSANKAALTWPESAAKGPSSPSPYIRALEPLIRAGYAAEMKRVCRPVGPEAALGPDELIRTLSLSGAKPGDAVQAKPDAFTPVGKKKFSVTELEEYLLCRYRYYQARVLKSAPVEDPDEDIAPHEAGSIIHEILRDFCAEHVEREDNSAALERLKGIALKQFKKLPRTLVNSELVRRFMEKVAPRFIETEARLAGGSFHVARTEEKIEAEVPDGEGGTITLTGKIDRVELDADGNFIVADYKTGKYPGSGKPLNKQFQLPLYAYILRSSEQTLGGKPPRPAGFVYYNLREGRMRDVVCYDADVLGESLKGVPAKRGKSCEEVDALIDKCVGEAVSAVKGIISGEFSPNCEEPFVCKSCSYIEVCRRGEAKADEEGVDSETDEAR